jgi:hypothetical protein
MTAALATSCADNSVKFECPTYAANAAPSDTISAKDARAIEEILGDAPRENAILEARAYLANAYPDLSDAAAADDFAAAYCKTFGESRALSDRDKSDRMKLWNRMIVATLLENRRGRSNEG